MSDETDSDKSARTRSPAYPSIPLSEAVEATRRLWDAQRKQEARIDTVISALGYSAKSGTALRYVAALKSYGLVEEAGSGDFRKLRITEAAQDILHLPAEDERHQLALRTAALTPAIHAVLWERYGVLLPSDSAIRPFLIRDKGYNDTVVSSVIKTYRSTFEYAKLDKKDLPNSNSELNSPKAVDRRFASSGELLTISGDENYHQVDFNEDAGQYLPVLVGRGRVARIPFPMTTDDYELLLGTLNLWKKRIIQDPPIQVDTPPAKSKFTLLYPAKAVWRNKDHDQPVVIVGTFGELNGEEWFKSDTNTGIPASQLSFAPAMADLPFRFGLTPGDHQDRLND